MGEILEKGLMIGFGLIIMTFFLSFINPILSMLMDPISTNDLNNYNNFVFIIDYGANFNPEEPNEVLSFNITLNNPINIQCKRLTDETEIQVNSKIKNITLNIKRIVFMDIESINGSFSMEFYYNLNIVSIKIKGN